MGPILDVSTEYEELVIGRNQGNSDTNSIADWATTGGANALVGSPFERNTAVPEGEDFWVLAYQAYLSRVISQDYYGFTVLTGSYSNFVGNAHASSCTHSLTVQGDLFGPSPIVLSGQVDNSLSVLAPGRYAVEATGTLSDGSGHAVEFTMRREVGGAEDLTAVSAELYVGTENHPYSVEVRRIYSGVRGDYSQSISRALTMWGGTTKTTAGSQDVDWTMSPYGEVSSISASGSYTRPYPLFDGPIGSGAPRPVITTETIHLDFHTSLASGSPEIQWTKMESHYANSIPSIIGRDMVTSFTFDSPQAGAVQDTLQGYLDAGGLSFAFQSTSSITPLPGGKLYHWIGSGQVQGMDLPSWDATFDPPLMGAFGFWSKLKSTVKGTAQVMGTVSMCAIAGLGCIATTAGGCALGGVTTVASLGTATPLGLAAAAGGVTACGAIAYGAEKVIDEIWEH